MIAAELHCRNGRCYGLDLSEPEANNKQRVFDEGKHAASRNLLATARLSCRISSSWDTRCNGVNSVNGWRPAPLIASGFWRVTNLLLACLLVYLLTKM